MGTEATSPQLDTYFDRDIKNYIQSMHYPSGGTCGLYDFTFSDQPLPTQDEADYSRRLVIQFTRTILYAEFFIYRNNNGPHVWIDILEHCSMSDGFTTIGRFDDVMESYLTMQPVIETPGFREVVVYKTC